MSLDNKFFRLSHNRRFIHSLKHIQNMYRWRQIKKILLKKICSDLVNYEIKHFYIRPYKKFIYFTNKGYLNGYFSFIRTDRNDYIKSYDYTDYLVTVFD